MDPSRTCPPIQGNPDIYGIGIRLGFYSQWLSTLLVTIFRQEEEALYRVVNIHLQLAVFACLVLLTISSPPADAPLYTSEVIISFWLLLGALSSTSGSSGIMFLTQGKLAGLARVGVYMALSGYGVWFWFGGLEVIEGRDIREGGCEQVAWFGGAGVRGGVRGFGKAASVGGLIVCVGLLGWAAGEMWKGRRTREYTAAPAGVEEGRLGRKATEGRAQRPQTEITLVLLSVGMIALSVASIEYLIQANSLVGVNDIFAVGQIIPLLVGAMGLVTTLVSIFWEGRIMEPRCVRIWNYHLS